MLTLAVNRCSGTALLEVGQAVWTQLRKPSLGVRLSPVHCHITSCQQGFSLGGYPRLFAGRKSANECRVTRLWLLGSQYEAAHTASEAANWFGGHFHIWATLCFLDGTNPSTCELTLKGVGLGTVKSFFPLKLLS